MRRRPYKYVRPLDSCQKQRIYLHNTLLSIFEDVDAKYLMFQIFCLSGLYGVGVLMDVCFAFLERYLGKCINDIIIYFYFYYNYRETY